MKTRRQLRAAERHLTAADPVLRDLISRVGPCTLRAGRIDLFHSLVRTVVSQQISSRAARAICDRLEARFAGIGLTPENIAAVRLPTLRACGLSQNKARTIKAIARAAIIGQLDLPRLPRLDDQSVARQLLPIPGVGPWSVDMVLIFGLARPDVLPVGDHGLRTAMQRHYRLPTLPLAAEMVRLAEPWRPYRSVATWYLWRSLGPVPQST